MAADGFIGRAALGDLKEVIRRLERKQTVDGKHSVRCCCRALDWPAHTAAMHVPLPLRRPLSQKLKYTALHAAADNGHLDVVKQLVKYNADLNAQRTVRYP